MTPTKPPTRTIAQPVASLTPGLLARKGHARPAMRSPLHDPLDDAWPAAHPFEDLGWNDMGDPVPKPQPIIPKPHVVLQQEAMSRLICVPSASRRPRGTALIEGRRAAFTLRLDAARHRGLRQACELTSQSAQSLLIEVLDRLLMDLPDLGPAISPEHSAPKRGTKP